MDLMAKVAKIPMDWRRVAGATLNEQRMQLDVGVARHSEQDASKRASVSRADVDSSAKLAHAWAPVLVRDCSVPKSMNEDT